MMVSVSSAGVVVACPVPPDWASAKLEKPQDAHSATKAVVEPSRFISSSHRESM
jgi:hypothetical protein